MKKVWILFFSLVLILSLSVPALADNGSLEVKLDAERTELYWNDTLEITVSVSGEGKCDGYGYYVTVDPAVFDIVSYELLDQNRTQFGIFDYQGLAVAYSQPATPSGTVCKVVLQVRPDAPLGEILLEGKAAAILANQPVNTTAGGVKLQVLCAHRFESWERIDENTHTGQCAVCGHVENTEHTWDTGAVIKKNTCTEPGTAVYVCTGCREVRVSELPPQHSYDHGCDAKCNVCGQTRSISHTYVEDWQYDADGHFQSCTLCGEVPAKHKHIPDRVEATAELPVSCEECGYIITPALSHKHHYAKTLTWDGENHWYACSGCMEKDSMEAHSFDGDCDAVCDTCGYTRTVIHQIGEDWHSEEDCHYRVCLLCGEKVDVLYHAPGEDATEFTPKSCLVCGKEISPALGHSMSQEWFFDEEVHYRQCQCGEKSELAAHSWSEHGENGVVSCTVCGAKKDAVPLPVWIGLGAALLIAIGCMTAVLIRRRKRTPEEEPEAEEPAEEDFAEEESAEEESAEEETPETV